MSRTAMMRSSGDLTSSMFTVASAPNLRASFSRGSSGAPTGTALAAAFHPRLPRRPDACAAPRAHRLRGRDRENSDRPGALAHRRVTPLEAPGFDRAIERADAGGERLGERAEAQAHVVGELVDFRPRQHVEIDINILGPAAPEMRRLLEAEVAPVVDRRQAFIGVLRIMNAVVAGAAWHQRRDHYLRADPKRLPHEIFGELRAGFDDHATELMAKCERPRQRLRPVAFQDVLVGAAHATRADLDQRGLPRHIRPRHGADHRRRAGPIEGRDADLVLGHVRRAWADPRIHLLL